MLGGNLGESNLGEVPEALTFDSVGEGRTSRCSPVEPALLSLSPDNSAPLPERLQGYCGGRLAAGQQDGSIAD